MHHNPDPKEDEPKVYVEAQIEIFELKRGGEKGPYT
jgi:hypothetical protein